VEDIVMPIGRLSLTTVLLSSAIILPGLAGARSAAAATITSFTGGDLVMISTVSCSVGATVCSSTSGGLDTASPIVLDEFSVGSAGTSATPSRHPCPAPNQQWCEFGDFR
jgi:hypothetical protein